MQLRIMCNNIWWCDENSPQWKEQGHDCSAAVRSVGLLRLYRETNPDIIGLQECSAQMTAELMIHIVNDRLPYTMLWGKDTPILYRKDKLELLDSDVCIYPEEIPGIEGSFNNLSTKSYCIGIFRVKENGKVFIFATTHLWWKSSDPDAQHYQPYSDEARAYQLNLLLDKVEKYCSKYNCPAVVVGDMNAVYDSVAVQSALNRGYSHGHDVATEYADESQGMHYCYADGFDTLPASGGFLKAIDHILVKNMPNGAVARFERYSPRYYMPLSDHFPVWIDVIID